MRLLLCLSLVLLSGQALARDALDRACTGRVSPLIEVQTDQAAPDISLGQSIHDLDGKAAAGNSYKPAGTEGPRWHTAGLTQSNIRIEQNVESHGLTRTDNKAGCVFIDKIALHVLLAPTVWVANEYAAGSCMYQAVRGHEMKHVNADRMVTTERLTHLRMVLSQLAQGKGVIGPMPTDQMHAAVDSFKASLKTLIQNEVNAYLEAEKTAQHNIDTLQEYQRVQNLCQK